MASIRDLLTRIGRAAGILPKAPKVKEPGFGPGKFDPARVVGHRGVAIGNTTDPDLRPEEWETLSGGEVLNFVRKQIFLPVNSTNVRGATYFQESNQMLVEFKGGSAYVYSNVSEQEAINFAQAASKGAWVWDNLRIRGTKYGHRKPYRRIR